MRTAACHVAGDGRWAAATVLGAQTDSNKLRFTIAASPGSCEPSTDSTIPESFYQTDGACAIV